MSTVNNGSQIVRDGLVLDLDASSRKSYPAIEVLIVAGGGSGGVDNGGGGGGGGVILTGLNIAVNTAYSIVVGAGGAARLGTSDDGPGNNGANSTAFGYTAIGGSGGTGWVNTTLPPGSATYSGGSGAGQSVSTGGTNSRGAGTGTSGQGYNGGTGVAAYAGGGGGAGGPGGNATNGNVGAGGEGLYVGNLFGYTVGVDGYVAGGGAGGFDYVSGYRSTLPFTRNGTTKKLTETGEDSCPNNTGAGGNGANHDNENSGGGGSGVVFVRYFGSQRATGGTIYSFRGYTIHRFDSNGTFTLTSGDTTTWYDLSGNNNNGTLYNGPTFNSSNGGNIVFNGTNNYLQANINSNILDGDPNFSVEFFVKRTADFVSSGFWGIGGAGQGYSIEGWTPTTNEIHLDLYDSTRLSSGVTYPLNTWVHVVWTKSGSTISTSTTKLYVNSNLTTLTLTRAQTTGPRYNTSTAGVGIALGRINGDANSNYAPITIGLFRIYSRPLSTTEVSQNYQSVKSRFGL